MTIVGGFQDRLSAALGEAFARETRRGVMLAALGRGVFFLIVTGVYVANAMTQPGKAVFYRQLDLVFLIQFAMIPASGLNYLLAIRSRTPIIWSYAFMALDMIVIAQNTWGWPWRPT